MAGTAPTEHDLSQQADRPNADEGAIVALEIFPYQYELSGGGYGCAKFIAGARAGTLVKVSTASGATGWGEAIGDPKLVVPAIIDQANILLGESTAVRASHVLKLISRRYHLTTGGPHMFAASAIDTALWDAYARSLNVPVSALLGGATRTSVPTYASTGYLMPGGDNLDALRHELTAAVEDGFDGAKIRIGVSAQSDAARVKLSREILGDDRTLMVDYNTHGTVNTVIKSLKAISEYDLTWVEEPLTPEDHAGWAQLRATGETLAGGESLCTRYGFRDAITTRRFDIAQPDLAACGGITEGWAIGQQALLHGVDFAPHCWGSGILQLATLQLLAATTSEPVATLDRAVFEWDRGDNPFREEVLTDTLELNNGAVVIPRGPGLGMEINEQWVRGHTENTVTVSQ